MDLHLFNKYLAAIIRTARTQSGLTQEQLAETSGMTRRYIQAVENEKQEATLSTLFQLCHAMRVSPGYIVAELEYALANGKLSDSVQASLPPKKIGRPHKSNA